MPCSALEKNNQAHHSCSAPPTPKRAVTGTFRLAMEAEQLRARLQSDPDKDRDSSNALTADASAVRYSGWLYGPPMTGTSWGASAPSLLCRGPHRGSEFVQSGTSRRSKTDLQQNKLEESRTRRPHRCASGLSVDRLTSIHFFLGPGTRTWKHALTASALRWHAALDQRVFIGKK